MRPVSLLQNGARIHGIMFSRGICGISIENNISAVVVKKSADRTPLSIARQLLFSHGDSDEMLMMTSSGEVMLFYDKKDADEESGPHQSELSKLTVSGVCMNTVGAKIYKKLADHGIRVLGASMCDIAASFIIGTNDSERAVSLVLDNFTLEP